MVRLLIIKLFSLPFPKWHYPSPFIRIDEKQVHGEALSATVIRARSEERG
jgi:hypothetical protein